MNRRSKRKLRLILFIAVVIVLGLTGMAAALVTDSKLPGSPVINGTVADVPGNPVSRWLDSAIVDGSGRAAFEQDFESSLVTTKVFRNLWNRMVYLLFAQTLSGAIVGRSDYLFTTEEWYENPENFRFPPAVLLESTPSESGRMPVEGAANSGTGGSDIDRKRPAPYPGYVAAVLAASEALGKMGIQLVVVLVPAKNRILTGYSKLRLSDLLSKRYQNVVRQLTDSGIQVIDLETTFRNQGQVETLYMRTDTHWSPEGARTAAEEVADFLSDYGLLDSTVKVGFESQVDGTERFRGDLFEFLPLPTKSGPAEPQVSFGPFSRILPEPETLTRYSTFPTADAFPLAGLFDTPSIPVALTGTSYAAGADWNFAGFLMEALGVDLVNLAQAGTGPFEPMVALLGDPILQEVGIELVIWEIPERYLIP